ncbi:MAG: DUF4416 family protein [Chitinispirillia bacterium]|nr:DUF4416 family protein [Chitinispirillia bacterium]MCL2242249.1 DUF4416 family protein [Chitinispirillia bacterium]
MGEIKKPQDVKLFAAVMYRPGFELGAAIDALTAEYGEVEASYGPIEFSWSDYYEGEMGARLLKYYVIFKGFCDRARLPGVKIHTNEMEMRFADGARRAVNIDPGYLSADKFVLASTKDFFHRLYLGDGIFGEVTLHYRKGRYRFFSWTYTDYQDPGFLKFLEAARTAAFFAGDR